MNIDYWIKIFEAAYKNGESIDLITGEKKGINFVFNDEKISFLIKDLESEIFTKLEDDEISLVKSGQISLLEYHFGDKRTIFNEEQHIMIKEAMEIMLAFFWKQIDDEYSFGDISRLSSASALGMSIEEKYSISEGPFLKLAETYWTFRIEARDLVKKHLTIPLTQILIQIEASFASYFFPLMSPLKPDELDIYEGQKYLLTKYTKIFNVEQFLYESPVLKTYKEGIPMKKSKFDSGDGESSMYGSTHFSEEILNYINTHRDEYNALGFFSVQKAIEYLDAKEDVDIEFIKEYCAEYIVSRNESGLICDRPDVIINHDIEEWRYEKCKKIFYEDGSADKILTDYKSTNQKSGGCFIATATFGDYNSTEVIFLREWRDKILMESIIGRLFVQSYYKISPFIAPIISKNNNLKKISKFLLIKFIHSFPDLNNSK